MSRTHRARRVRQHTPPRVTPLLAARHEALWLRLSALRTQIAPLAQRRPRAPVSADTAAIAQDLLRAAFPFLAADAPLPVAPDHEALLTRLGQALAQLEAWELANTAWRAELNAFVWTVAGDAALPLRRLRPKLITPKPVAAQGSPVRNELYRRIMALKEAARP